LPRFDFFEIPSPKLLRRFENQNFSWFLSFVSLLFPIILVIMLFAVIVVFPDVEVVDDDAQGFNLAHVQLLLGPLQGFA
jgi:hypothetical protein